MRRALTICFSTIAFVFDELARITAPPRPDAHPMYRTRAETNGAEHLGDAVIARDLKG